MKPDEIKYIRERAGMESAKKIAAELGIKERKVKRFLDSEKFKIEHSSHPQIKQSVKKRFWIFSAVIIILLGFIIYANSLGGEFILDDDSLIRENFSIKTLSSPLKIFTEDIGKGSGRMSNFYRPAQMFTYAVDYKIWGLNVLGYHLTNVILHILVGLSICYLVNLLCADGMLSLITSLLFLSSPVHTEAVSYISGRADPLVTLFMLLAFIFYVKTLSSWSLPQYVVMLACYFISLFSRENALILPVLLLIYHYAFGKKIDWKRFMPVLIVSAFYMLLRVTVFQSSLPHTSATTVFQRLPGFLVAITTYLRLMVLPLDLHMGYYGIKLFRMTNPMAIIGFFILCTLLYYAFKKRKDPGVISFSILWFIIALLPMSNLYPINAYMAEHWLYLPSIGLFLLASVSLNSIYKIKVLKIPAISITIILVLFYSALTIAQNNYWKDPLTFYTRTLKYEPDSYLMNNNLANVYSKLGDKEKAISFYNKALVFNPNYVESYINLGSAYDDMGSKEEAIKMFKKAIEIDPENYPHAYINIGIVYSSINKTDDAISAFKKAIELSPSLPYAYSGLGLIYAKMGKKNEAIDLCKRAIDINPNFARSYNDLAKAFTYIGEEKAAIEAYKKAAAIDPNYPETQMGLAVLYYNKGMVKQALEHYNIALRLGARPNPELERALAPYREQ